MAHHSDRVALLISNRINGSSRPWPVQHWGDMTPMHFLHPARARLVLEHCGA
jgi:hypothetical protein